MTKALTVLGGIAIIAIVAAYPVGAVIALAVPLAVCSASCGGSPTRRWRSAGPAAAPGSTGHRPRSAAGTTPTRWPPPPTPTDEPHTAEVVVKGARRADPRRVG